MFRPQPLNVLEELLKIKEENQQENESSDLAIIEFKSPEAERFELLGHLVRND